MGFIGYDAMRAYLHRQRASLTVESLPAYTPDLNPVVQIWGNVQGELATVCPTEIAALLVPLRPGFNRIRRQLELGLAFLRHAGRSL